MVGVAELDRETRDAAGLMKMAEREEALETKKPLERLGPVPEGGQAATA